MEIKQINSTIKSRAAVAFAPNQPLQIVEIDVEMPRKGEVLIRNTHTGVCHTDAFTLSGSDPEGVFPVVLGHETGRSSFFSWVTVPVVVELSNLSSSRQPFG